MLLGEIYSMNYVAFVLLFLFFSFLLSPLLMHVMFLRTKSSFQHRVTNVILDDSRVPRNPHDLDGCD